MPRIAGIDVPNEKPVLIALTYIHGIVSHLAKQVLKEAQIAETVRAKELTDDELMRPHSSSVEESRESIVATPEVVHPHRRIHENHFECLTVRRRGATASWGCVPPSEAKRRALARLIRASKPARTKAVFSSIWVKRRASSSSASSMLSVVLICISMH